MNDAILVAAWDANASGWGWNRKRGLAEVSEWCKANGLIGDPVDEYRIDIYLLDAPFARVYRYARNGDGDLFHDLATGRFATLPPVDTPIAELPPEHLRFVRLP